MKKSILVISLLSSTFIMYPDITIASGIPTYTHTYTPELKPISSDYVKLAAVCFLGTGGCGSVGFGKADDNMDIDTGNQCKNDGYSITSCSLPTYPNGACPYNGAYFAKCVADKPRACKESGFSETLCPNGYVVDASCPYDSSYKTCKENPCSGYSTCECGATSGATTCYSGSTLKYSGCQTCDPCSGYYDCGGSWQYCTGRTCATDSSRCSSYCEGDHFPYPCGSDYGTCDGDYRNGYCSVSCDKTSPDSSSGSSGDSSSSSHHTYSYVSNCYCYLSSDAGWCHYADVDKECRHKDTGAVLNSHSTISSHGCRGSESDCLSSNCSNVGYWYQSGTCSE